MSWLICPTCPWRVDSDPADIPNFDMELAQSLCTQSEQGFGPMKDPEKANSHYWQAFLLEDCEEMSEFERLEIVRLNPPLNIAHRTGPSGFAGARAPDRFKGTA